MMKVIARGDQCSKRGRFPLGVFVLAVAALIVTLSLSSVQAAGPKGPSETTRLMNKALFDTLPFSDRKDFADAARGLIDPGPAVITNVKGEIVWDINQYWFLSEEKPLETINPSLRRQAVLNNMRGLFKVTDRVYQVRGFDLANMGIVESDGGYIVIDPLTSVDTARAAMELVYRHCGKKPVMAVIYSHSHVDHFGGVGGIVSEADVGAGTVKVIAPTAFMEEAVSENIFAGNAMIRRAQYMFGALLPRGPEGQVDAGLGKSTPRLVSVSLIHPTDIVERTGQEMTIDGVRVVFHNVPGTEAPANMNFYFPELRALFMADNVVATLHNLLTPRGSQVRDARRWAGFIVEAIDLFGDRAEVVFLGHSWPRWEKDNIVNFLRKQADAYKYIHDQTLRLANLGYTMVEIAEEIRLPDELAAEWFNRSYYASVGWNAKAVYQRYLGWFDGNPANYNPLPPVESSKRYIEYMGGAEQVLARARQDFESGDYRWVAQVVNHLVFAEPDNEAARLLQADTLEQLGYQSESAVFRNFYLFGARELREGVQRPFDRMPPAPDIYRALTLDMIFDSMAVRLNGPKAAGKTIVINWHFADTDERLVLSLKNAVLRHRTGADPAADCSLTLTRALLNDIISGTTTFPAQLQQGNIAHEGALAKLGQLVSLLDGFNLWFNIVTP